MTTFICTGILHTLCTIYETYSRLKIYISGIFATAYSLNPLNVPQKQIFCLRTPYECESLKCFRSLMMIDTTPTNETLEALEGPQ